MILRHAKRAHVGLGYLAAVAVLAFALLLGLVSLALPVLAQHPAQVRAWLEHRTKRPVAFSGLRTHWTKLGPLIELRDLRIGEGDRAVAIGDAELLASVYLGLLPGHAFTELRLRGLDLTLERGADGLWQVRGLPGQKQDTTGDPFAVVERLGELHVIDGRLAIVAPAYGIDTAVPRIDLRLRVDGPRVRAGLRAWPRAGGPPVDGVLDFDRVAGRGRAYAGTGDADLRDWADVLHAGGVRVSAGRGTARAWAELRGGRVVQVTAQGALTGVRLDGAPLDGAVPGAVFDRVDALGVWRMAAGQWRVALPTLRVQQGASKQVLDGLALAGGGHFDLDARAVDIGPLLQAAALTDRLPEATRRWMRRAQPVGQAADVRLRTRAGHTSVDARLAGLGFARVGNAPGLQGVSGRVTGDTDGLQLDFDPARAIRFSWPQAFGADHVVHLAGRAGIWRDGAGWRVGTNALHVAGQGYSADARGGLLWQGDGSRPFIDMAVDIGAAQVPVARRFWVRNLMSPSLVAWLDGALLAGHLESGRAVIVGDLDDWPFRHHEGSFDARGRVVGGTVKFQPDWPAAEDVDAQLAFDGTGFDIQGSGRIGQVRMPVLKATIDDYRDGALTVEAHGDAEAARLLDVVRASGLRRMQPETIDALSASGPAHVDFALRMPLQRGAPLSIDGDVDLRGATLADRRWNLRFDEVRGRAHYDLRGFSAADLAVRHDGQPGALSLRAGDGHVRAAANVFEGDVAGTFDIDDLLSRAPEMAWLSPYVAGRSAWTVGVVVPKGAGNDVPAHLQLRSNLAGTSLELPAPLRKPASQTLAAFVDTPLPLGSGEVRVGLGNLMGVRARTDRGRTGVRVVLGDGTVDEPAPASGLVATGRASQLDALDWIAFTRGDDAGSGSGSGLSLQKIDVTTPRLAMFGGQFGESRLQVAPLAGGALSVRVDGATLAGGVTVPAGAGPIAGRFSRVYWKGAPPTGVAASTAAPRVAAPTAATLRSRPAASRPSPAPASVDPSKVPPLAIDVDDLRIGPAQFGVARLRTHATPVGLVLDQFSARGRSHRLEATGEWTGRGNAARSRVAAAVDSQDFGALLDGFGLGGRLGGGKGTVRFDAAWVGAPSDVSLGSLQGTLALSARNGRLLQVDPGAGRVLGLLSLAELPRRLTLDFRDFFNKGFSFNELGGNIRFAGGLARSDDLAIKGPAADIRISGAANLRAQTFDQTVEVRPKTGNVLTAVGALAGGPVGAAIGAAASAVMAKPFGNLGAKTYRVTGPWSEPKVEVMTRDQTRAVAAARPAG